MTPDQIKQLLQFTQLNDDYLQTFSHSKQYCRMRWHFARWACNNNKTIEWNESILHFVHFEYSDTWNRTERVNNFVQSGCTFQDNLICVTQRDYRCARDVIGNFGTKTSGRAWCVFPAREVETERKKIPRPRKTILVPCCNGGSIGSPSFDTIYYLIASRAIRSLRRKWTGARREMYPSRVRRRARVDLCRSMQQLMMFAVPTEELA